MMVGNNQQKNTGFTIVELAIVLVVIAALSIVLFISYRGIQERSRDAQRVSDINFITNALEHYYLENKQYPSSSGSTSINGAWSTTADASWSNLKSQLDPYTDNTLPVDPSTVPGGGIYSFNYMYYSGAICGGSARQGYLLIYKLEASAQVNTNKGECPGTVPGLYGGMSNYRMTRFTP